MKRGEESLSGEEEDAAAERARHTREARVPRHVVFLVHLGVLFVFHVDRVLDVSVQRLQDLVGGRGLLEQRVGRHEVLGGQVRAARVEQHFGGDVKVVLLAEPPGVPRGDQIEDVDALGQPSERSDLPALHDALTKPVEQQLGEDHVQVVVHGRDQPHRLGHRVPPLKRRVRLHAQLPRVVPQLELSHVPHRHLRLAAHEFGLLARVHRRCHRKLGGTRLQCLG